MCSVLGNFLAGPGRGDGQRKDVEGGDRGKYFVSPFLPPHFIFHKNTALQYVIIYSCLSVDADHGMVTGNHSFGTDYRA